MKSTTCNRSVILIPPCPNVFYQHGDDAARLFSATSGTVVAVTASVELVRALSMIFSMGERGLSAKRDDLGSAGSCGFQLGRKACANDFGRHVFHNFDHWPQSYFSFVPSRARHVSLGDYCSPERVHSGQVSPIESNTSAIATAAAWAETPDGGS